jgi:release factor glutamine methyltransferase
LTGVAIGVATLLREGTARLEAAGLPGARRDAERLLARLLGTSRLALYLERDRPVGPGAAEQYQALLVRRAEREPLQYLLGEDEFCGLSILVRPGVFIPRPETELLVERVLACLPPAAGGARWGVDLGTGTGCVALALTHRRPDLRVVAVDRAPEAAGLARENAARLGLVDRVEVREGDLWEPVQDLRGRLDLVASNPPYIARELLEELPVEVSNFEPALALDGGPGGTRVHERIIGEAPVFLRSGGLLAMELGLGHAERLADVVRATGVFTDIATVPDLLGIARVLTARRV